jgi:uroporphyrin-III C-methyltransferase
MLGLGRWIAFGGALLAALTAAAMVFAWNTQQRVKSLESELVKRQQDSGSQAAEARVAARAAQDLARESAGKLALLEARVAEASLQRSQLEDLIQSLSRSRDENVLADVDAAVRVALQQTAITGSAEPMVAALRQSDERLARYNQPRMERVRRAIAQDLDRVRAAGVSDITVLTIRLDEVIRLVDELPLLAADRKPGPRAAPVPAAAASAPSWGNAARDRWQAWADTVWQEVRSLVRVTRIDNPEAMLVAPEQAFFLRENLKLRLLNARLALLSRQFDTAQSDLREAQNTLERYFERGHKRVVLALEGVKQVGAQSRLVSVPRPEATLAAIATATAGR